MSECVQKSVMRMQMIESISSMDPKTHDLRRRLAMSFCLNDVSCSKQHSHEIMSMERFLERINSNDFDANPRDTDYRELAALVSLLDIAIDDGRSDNLDLSDPETEKEFDDYVELLAKAINDIIKAIGNPGTSFISKIEAKEHLLLVSRRIADTVRSRPKPKKSFIDEGMKREYALQAQQRGLAKFVVKKERVMN